MIMTTNGKTSNCCDRHLIINKDSRFDFVNIVIITVPTIVVVVVIIIVVVS